MTDTGLTRREFLRGTALGLPLVALGAGPQEIAVSVDHTRTIGVSRLSLGVTHGHHSLDPDGDPQAVRRGTALLAAACRYQNQHLMGWGADNPNPAPGVYDWRSLDRRVALIRTMGATPVITLCGAPDWMKGGTPGRTDWTRLEAAPLRQHFPDFAALAATVARRYPDVQHFQVWNEMKGLWDPAINNWDYRAYTDLYNPVYDALKSVNPQIRVGGPYLVIEGTGSNKGGWATEAPIRARQWDVLDYWLAHKRGADFLSLDRGVKDFHDDHTYTPGEMMALTRTFGDVARQVRARIGLPLWWAEYYGATFSPDFVAAHYAAILRQMVLSGAFVALLWSPQQDDVPHALFTDTRVPGGGRPLPHYAAFKAVHDHFGPGTRLCAVRTSSPDIEALASPAVTWLINVADRPARVRLNGRALTLPPYGVRLQNKP